MRTVALSTVEAESMAAAEAAKEVIWLRGILSEMGFPQEEPTPIMEDSQGAIDLSVSSRHHARTKHIRIRYHFIRQLIGQGELALVKVSTDHQLADLLTKPLSRPRFLKLRDRMMTE